MHENDDSQFFVIYHFELHTNYFIRHFYSHNFSTPGVMASTRGEIIVLEKCVDVSSKVMVRYTDKCYHDLPVYNNNEKKFLSPTSKIIDDSNQVFCENEHSVYKFRDAYFSQSPKITPFHKKVTLLKPDQKNFSIYGDDLLPNHLNR